MFIRFTMCISKDILHAASAIALAILGTTCVSAAQGISSEWDEGAPRTSSAATVSVAPTFAPEVPSQALKATPPDRRSKSQQTTKDAAAEATEAQAASMAAAPSQSKSGEYAAPNWSSYYRSVDAIRSDTQKAQAELENLKIHHELDQARNGLFEQNGGGVVPIASPTSQIGMSSSSGGAAAARVDREPLVQEVSMVDGRWMAVIQLSTGARMTVHQGETVRGLGKVESIALGQVVVSSGGKTSSLQFASDNIAAAAPSTAQQGVRTMTSPVPFGMH